MAEVIWGQRERPLSEHEYQALLALWRTLLTDPDAEDPDTPARPDDER